MKPLQRVAFIGNHLPRRCGIATFTHDLHRAVATARPELETCIVAMTDRGAVYRYPEAVRVQVRAAEVDDYVQAAATLNTGRFDVVSLQHEYGIFGGEAGGHIVELLSRLEMPVVTTLHTVLQEPAPAQHAVMRRIVQASTTLIVMADKGRELLQSVHGVPAGKIKVIPHGIPDFPYVEPDCAKAKLGFNRRTVILTFGLLSPSKGIETVIDAMPGIIKSCPDAVYVVLGATHPNLVRDQGEAYRESLTARALDLGVADHVVFINKFVDQPTLLDYISMCDIYVTPYLNESQMTSGTLAYSFGLGKAVVSTPYWHAKELLAEGRGSLVPFGDATSIGSEIAALLTNDVRRHAMRRRAYAASRSMTWAPTAECYVTAFDSANEAAHPHQDAAALRTGVRQAPPVFPEVKTDHFLSMCDSTGLLQHAVHSVPDRSHGYCVDDNARALLLACELGGPGSPRLPEAMTARFAAFIQHAWNPDTRRFRNFMSYDRRWLEDKGSEDSHGRTLWALGHCSRDDTDPSRRRWAAALFVSALPVVEHFSSPRAWAFTLLGLDAYHAATSDGLVVDRMRRLLADRMLAMLSARKLRYWPENWHWFEDVLAYDNARLPQALIQTGLTTQTPAYVVAGLRSLRWLVSIQTAPTGSFRPVGSSGFGKRFQKPAAFDQQPLEAAATISACLAAALAEDNGEWPVEAMRAFAWFLGRNELKIPLIDPETGSCLDGLHPDRANANMGAESVLSYLLGLVEIREFQRNARVDRTKLASISAPKSDSRAAPRTSSGGSRLVTIPVLEPTFLAPAPGSGAGRRQAVQTGN